MSSRSTSVNNLKHFTSLSVVANKINNSSSSSVISSHKTDKTIQNINENLSTITSSNSSSSNISNKSLAIIDTLKSHLNETNISETKVYFSILY